MRPCATVFFGAALAFAQTASIPLDHPAIQYATGTRTDPVAELNSRMKQGKTNLAFDDKQGYLRSILAALHVPIESQMAVFSKTSVQAVLLVDPRRPRTLFFNDSVIVGYVRGGLLEVAAQDREQGMSFYTLNQRPWTYNEVRADPSAKPQPLLVRRQDCLNCHLSKSTLGVPGALVRSVFPRGDGMPLTRLGSFNTDQRTPFEHLWGGWYVTGKSGSAQHMGNAVVTNASNNLESLRGKFDPDAYLSPYSDIVALMVFEHQMHMMNLLTRIGWESRAGIDPRATAAELVDYMLFVDEAPLKDKIEGTSGFAEEFAARGPFDSQGRSLRQFDLQRRLMRYPCSYMIYTEAFDALPAAAKAIIYGRMWQILSGQEDAAKYARLSPADRTAIVEILRDTKKDLPDSFR